MNILHCVAAFLKIWGCSFQGIFMCSCFFAVLWQYLLKSAFFFFFTYCIYVLTKVRCCVYVTFAFHKCFVWIQRHEIGDFLPVNIVSEILCHLCWFDWDWLQSLLAASWCAVLMFSTLSPPHPPIPCLHIFPAIPCFYLLLILPLKSMILGGLDSLYPPCYCQTSSSGPLLNPWLLPLSQ